MQGQSLNASLGWAADEVDQELAGRFRMIETGEYKRASQLLEKAVYGEAFLEPFEERTLYSFLDKLTEAARSTGLAVRLRIRYLVFLKKNKFRKKVVYYLTNARLYGRQIERQERKR